jgi:alpha-tubulin suppressor-like RCC1 family protein
VGIAAGYNTTLAWTADGRLFGWGSNGAGGLGNGTASNEFTPQEALGVRVKAATSSGSYSLAVGTDGQIYTFGENYSYNLGSSELPFTEEPQLVPGLPGPIAYVAAGDSTTLAITQGGDVYTWGDNWCGQLGTGDMDSRVAPTRVVGVTGAVQADIHHGHAAVLTADGEVWAWGSNTSGELGREPGELQESIPTPVKVDLPPEVGQPVLVATGYNFTMLLTEEGEIWGWGNNNPGWFGPASHDPVPQPSLVDTDWDDAATTALSVGGEWVAVALVDGTPYGFGADWSSQIGGRGLVQAKLPIVGLPDKTIVQADTSAYSTAALDQDGDVWTLGRGYDQELGRPYTGDGDPIPKVVDGLHGISAVAAGDTLGMALSGDRGSVYTWGTWGRANLSYYALTDHAYIPVRASGFHDSIKQIAAGKNHAVALTDSGEVYTWGVNSSGQLGYVSPTWVPEIRVVDLQFWDPPETPEPSDTQSTDPGDTGSPTPTDSGSTAPTTSGSPTPSDTGSPTPSDTASTDPTGTGSATPSDSGSAAPTTSGSPTPSNTPSTDPTDTASGDPTDPPATPSAPSDTDSGDETDDPGGPDPGTPPDTGGTAPGTAREDSTDRSDDATGLGTGTSARDPGAASIGGTAPHGTTPRIARFGTRFKTVVIPSGTTAALKVAAYTAAGTQVGPARVTWTTSRASVASPVKGTKTGRVSWRTGSAATLNIKALAAGRTQVTLTSPGARPATIQIKVVLAAKAKAKQLRAVTLTGPATLAAGRSAVLKPVLRPRGAVRTGARWRSTDPAVATVDAVGRVTGIAAGRAVIVLTAGGKTATKTITITANP